MVAALTTEAQRVLVTASLALAVGPLVASPTVPWQTRVEPDAQGLIYFSSPLVHEGRNDNGHLFLREQMERFFPTLIGRPLDKDHLMLCDAIVGGISDAAYVVELGVPTIRIAGYIHAGYYPDFAWKVASGLVRGISMEVLFDRYEIRQQGKALFDLNFVGAGFTRMPADRYSLLDKVAGQPLAVAHRRRQLLLTAAAIHARKAA